MISARTFPWRCERKMSQMKSYMRMMIQMKRKMNQLKFYLRDMRLRKNHY
jgi:hypothetical protein